MIELDLLAWLFLGCGAFIVGFSKTAVPVAATLAVAIFAFVLPARESTAALLVILLIGDLFAVWMYRRTVDWMTLRRLILPVLLGLAVGAVFLAFSSDTAVRRVIGGILLVLLLFTLWQRRRARQGDREGSAAQEEGSAVQQPPRTAGYAYGWLGGFTTMVANAGGPVMSMYLLSMRLPVHTFLGTAAYFFFAINLLKVPFHVGLGLLNSQTLLIALTLAPLVVLAAFAGRRVVDRISQQFFDRIVLALTAAGAINLLI